MNLPITVICDTELPHNDESARFFDARSKAARCTGCFGCWLKTPGECVMHDGTEHIGSTIAKSEQVWIFSEIVYGGFSAAVKRVLDRCIPSVLPFFSRRHARMHHAARYPNRPAFHIVFHHAECATEQERALAEKTARAMAINFNCSECTVQFVQGAPSGKEMVHA